MGIFDNIKSLVSSPNQANPQQPAAAAPVAVKKVLIVEDEKMLGDALSVKLTRAGFQVIRAENGQAGLDLVASQKPNVVLLDLMMPVMDGKTFLEKLRGIPEFKNLPVIVLTNSGSVDNMRETKTYFNAAEFFVKSNTSLDQIIEKITALT